MASCRLSSSADAASRQDVAGSPGVRQRACQRCLATRPARLQASALAGWSSVSWRAATPRLLVPAQPVEADDALAACLEVVWRLGQRGLELFQREGELRQAHQRAMAGLETRFHGQGLHRRFFGQHEDVAGAVLLLRHAKPAAPGLVALCEFVVATEQQVLPARLLQVRQQRVDRAHLAARAGVLRLARHLGQGGAVGGQRGRVGRAGGHAVTQLAVGVDVEGAGVARALHQHHAACAQRVAHTELVPDVGVVQRQVGHHEVGGQQLLEHVGADVAGPLFFVSAEDLKTGVFQRGFDELAVDAVEVDGLAVGPGLGAEGHGHEGVAFHQALAFRVRAGARVAAARAGWTVRH
jgi:hypothetical protein